MRALARVRVFIKMRAVELRKAVCVARKVRRSPIKNDADTGLMAAIDEFHEFGGMAEAARRGEIAKRLIAPRAVKGVLHDGQQFDVRIAHLFDIRNELVG